MSRKRSTSFRGEQNAPSLPKEFKRKQTGLDPEILRNASLAATFKETVKRHLAEHRDELEVSLPHLLISSPWLIDVNE